MDWQSACAWGAAGGALVEVVNLSARMMEWRDARYAARMTTGELPKLGKHLDPLADGLVALTRLGLGVLAGLIFHGQITGAEAAVAVGATAPALLRQFGASRTHDVLEGKVPRPRVLVPAGTAEPDLGTPSIPVERNGSGGDRRREAVE